MPRSAGGGEAEGRPLLRGEGAKGACDFLTTQTHYYPQFILKSSMKSTMSPPLRPDPIPGAPGLPFFVILGVDTMLNHKFRGTHANRAGRRQPSRRARLVELTGLELL